MTSPFNQAYQTTKSLLKTKEDVNLVIARYMFEKFGTFPEEVIKLDDYQKGIIFAFLEDIVDVHEAQVKRQELEMKMRRRNRH